MKYIVVYIIIILGVSPLNLSAQKTTIDLLPTASSGAPALTMTDTCANPDSLFLIDSLVIPAQLKEKTGKETGEKEEQKPALRNITLKSAALVKPGLYPLFIKNRTPIRFIIYFTALKF